MNKNLLCFLVFSIIFFSTGSFADTGAEKIISSWQGKFDKFSTYTAQYSQTIYQGNELSGKTSGRVFFKKPHFFRWEVDIPEKQIIIGDGEIIWLYLPKNQQLIKKSYSPEESFGPFWFTSTEPIAKIKKHFAIKKPLSVKSKEGTIEILEFRPLKKTVEINQVNLWLEPNSFLPLKVEVFLKDGTITRFIYNDIQMDISLPQELFQLKVLDGIEIFED